MAIFHFFWRGRRSGLARDWRHATAGGSTVEHYCWMRLTLELYPLHKERTA